MEPVPFEPNHLEFFATVTLHKNQDYTAKQIEGWLTRLVHTVDMHELKPAEAVSCQDLGNEGISGIVMLKESHSSIHIWDKTEQPYLKLVLYSCKGFPVIPIIEMFKELGARICRWELKDRNHLSETHLLFGQMYEVIMSGVHEYR